MALTFHLNPRFVVQLALACAARDGNLVLLGPDLVLFKAFSPKSGPQEVLVPYLVPIELSGPKFGPF